MSFREILSLVLKFDILWKFVYPAFSLKQTKINDEAEQHWNKSCPPQSQKRQTMPNTKAIRKRTRPITWYKTCCIRYYSIKTLWWLFTSIVINWISKNQKYICDMWYWDRKWSISAWWKNHLQNYAYNKVDITKGWPRLRTWIVMLTKLTPHPRV